MKPATNKSLDASGGSVSKDDGGRMKDEIAAKGALMRAAASTVRRLDGQNVQ